jgi:hypothetical protein
MAVLDYRTLVSTIAIISLAWLTSKTVWLLKDRQQRVKKLVCHPPSLHEYRPIPGYAISKVVKAINLVQSHIF